MKRIVSLLAIALLVASCAPKDSQNQYKASEVGISHAVEFGTVLHVREVQINAKDSDVGTLAGAGVGGGAASYIGNGSGSIWATAGGAVAGAVAGYYAEHAITDRTGLEYVVHLQSGETKTIVQEKLDDEVAFKAGDHVMMQYCDAGEHARKCGDGTQYQRLLPVDKLPPYQKNKRKYVGYEQTREEKVIKSETN